MITEAEKLLSKITPGPWIAKPRPDKPTRCDGICPAHNHGEDVDCYDRDDCPAHNEIVTTDSGYYGPEWDDAVFIAAAPQVVRELLAVIVSLREERELEARLLKAGQLHRSECPCAIYEDSTCDDIPADVECICGTESLAHRWKARCVLLRAECTRLREENEELKRGARLARIDAGGW